MPKPDQTTLSHTDAAQLLGVHRTRAAQLVTEGVLVATGKGRVTLASVAEHLAELREAADTLSMSAEARERYEADKARKMAADADLAEIHVARAAGALVVAAAVGGAWENAIGVAVTKLMQVGDKVAATVILERQPKPAAAIINAGIRAALEEIHALDIAALATEQPAD